MTEQSAGTQADMTKMSGICPTQLEGTNVAVDEISGGVALRFTGSEDVMELQRRVAHMAEMHDYRSTMMGQGQAQGRGQRRGHRMMPPVIARSENIDGGAMLVLTPRDPDQLSQLRRHARMMSEQMASGECPMMGQQGEPKEPDQGSDQ